MRKAESNFQHMCRGNLIEWKGGKFTFGASSRGPLSLMWLNPKGELVHCVDQWAVTSLELLDMILEGEQI